MRKPFATLIIALLITSLSLSGCASGGFSGNLNDPNNPSIQMLRAATRIGLAVTLRQSGVSVERTNEILTELTAIADAVIAGEGLGVVLDSRWQVVRADVIARVSLVIVTYSSVDGVPVVDDITATQLAAAVVDSFAGAIRKMLVKSQPPAA